VIGELKTSVEYFQVRLLVGVLKSVGTGDLTVSDGLFSVYVSHSCTCTHIVVSLIIS